MTGRVPFSSGRSTTLSHLRKLFICTRNGVPLVPVDKSWARATHGPLQHVSKKNRDPYNLSRSQGIFLNKQDNAVIFPILGAPVIPHLYLSRHGGSKDCEPSNLSHRSSQYLCAGSGQKATTSSTFDPHLLGTTPASHPPTLERGHISPVAGHFVALSRRGVPRYASNLSRKP
ncbi:uncharacterized protein EI90DRAFT_1232434 [Cantharellus anzutake]|uniref:uncharacterized protein n=1 Tax=Cantharellus anzutake TaxID=1750568 RepID=UPI0019032D8D|nr:uncharacterized protein EI90DRAFT_1232434 [Cantharellus anzutake]KAF8330196.1 hypothetical protein EI90DRAFT_1232434 [Cantharellus anzutake]